MIVHKLRLLMFPADGHQSTLQKDFGLTGSHELRAKFIDEDELCLIIDLWHAKDLFLGQSGDEFRARQTTDHVHQRCFPRVLFSYQSQLRGLWWQLGSQQTLIKFDNEEHLLFHVGKAVVDRFSKRSTAEVDVLADVDENSRRNFSEVLFRVGAWRLWSTREFEEGSVGQFNDVWIENKLSDGLKGKKERNPDSFRRSQNKK